MADSEPKYYVKSFLEENHRHILVHWDGYDTPETHTWEPKSNLKEDLLGEYFKFIVKMKENKANPPAEKE